MTQDGVRLHEDLNILGKTPVRLCHSSGTVVTMARPTASPADPSTHKCSAWQRGTTGGVA